jgi:hypothetical protein
VVRLPPALRPLFPYAKPAYTTGTRLLAPAALRLSGRDERALPRRVAPTLREAALATGGRYATARPPELLTRPPLEGLPRDLPPSDDADGESLDGIGVAELPGGRVLGPHRAVVASGGVLVDEVSRYFGTRTAREHPLFLQPFPHEPLDVPGRLGVLAARGDGNYYHFLMDVLTRIGVREQAPSITAPERWYVPRGSAFQRQLLTLLGVGEGQCVDAAAHPHVRAECLVVPQPPAMSEKNPPWAVQWLRSRLLPQVDVPARRRRLYVTRGSARHNRTVRNEREVVTHLAARGFEVIDPGALPVTAQLAAFAAAELIVAPHGAALANLVVAPPDAAVVELFPAGCLLPDFWRLACGVPGLRYRYLAAPGPPPRRGRAAVIVRDIDVPLAQLDELLDELS